MCTHPKGFGKSKGGVEGSQKPKINTFINQNWNFQRYGRVELKKKGFFVIILPLVFTYFFEWVYVF